MAYRVYICTWTGTGTREDPWRSKAQTYFSAGVHNYFPALEDGSPASPWVVSVIRQQTDFTAIDADPECDDLFAGDLPAAINSRDELVAFLRARTVGDVPLVRRQAIQAVLDKYAVPRADFTLATRLVKVMQRVISTLWEKDDNYGLSF